MANAPEVDYSGKEVARDPLHDSYGLEVDGRGIEAVRSLRPPEPEPEPRVSFWRRYRLAILIVLALVVVGAIVGGAVGGTVGSHHHADENPQMTATRTATTGIASASQTGATRSAPAGMSGTATPEVKALPTAIPGTFSDQNGSLAVYIRGNDGHTYWKTFSNDAWDSSFRLATSENYQDVVPVKSAANLLELLVRTSEYEVAPLIGSISPSDGPGATWRFTLSLGWPGGYATSGVEVVISNDTSIFAFMIGFDGILYHSIWQNASSASGTLADGWSNWLWFGADDNATTDWYKYTPTATVSWTYQNNQWEPLWDVFGVRQLDQAIWHRTFRDGYWSPAFVSRGGYCAGRPVAVDVGNGPVFDMLVFVRGGDGRLWYLPHDSATGWSEFKPLGELTFVGEPMVLHSANDTQIDVFVCSAADHGIWHTSFDITSGQWSNSWESLGGDFDSSPKAISTKLGRIDIFAVGRQGQLRWKKRDESTLQWMDGWDDLGTPST